MNTFWPQGPIFRLTKEGVVRCCYEQCDGEIILADACKCRAEWGPDPADAEEAKLMCRQQRSIFTVIRSIDCPIDEHKAEALQLLKDHDQSAVDPPPFLA